MFDYWANNEASAFSKATDALVASLGPSPSQGVSIKTATGEAYKFVVTSYMRRTEGQDDLAGPCVTPWVRINSEAEEAATM